VMAAGLIVDRDRWRVECEELMGRIATRFSRSSRAGMPGIRRSRPASAAAAANKECTRIVDGDHCCCIPPLAKSDD
jgi:hypothetical protein